MTYQITKRVTGGADPARLSPADFMNYKSEQKMLREAINTALVNAGRKPLFTCDFVDFSKYHIDGAIALTGETKLKPLDGFKIQTREKMLDIVEYNVDGAVTSGAVLQTFSDNIGLNKKRGKYNDGALLADADSASIEFDELIDTRFGC